MSNISVLTLVESALKDLSTLSSADKNGEIILSRGQLDHLKAALTSSRSEIESLTRQLESKRDLIHLHYKELDAIKSHVRHEVGEIKKELLVPGAQTSGAEFRAALRDYLSNLKQELTSLQSNKNNLKDERSQQTLSEVKKGLVKIREQVEKRESEAETIKSTLTRQLSQLRSELEQIEKHKVKTDATIRNLQKENKELRQGNRIPTRLQEELRDRLNILKEEVFKIETENIELKMNSGPDPLKQIANEVSLCAVDMHTGGEPLRIVDGQMLALPTEASLLQKRQYMMNYLDHYRKILMCEPRGHFDMYGCVLTPPDDSNVSDFGVIFMHNSGYSSMCGHAILALGRYAVDFGVYHCKAIDDPLFQGERLVRIQVPCGIVQVRVQVKAGKSTGYVKFLSAPAWAEHTKFIMSMEQYGRIEVDVGYGGTYYVIVPATRFNMDVKKAPLDDLINLGMTLKHFAEKKLALANPDSKDLEFVYGTILTDGVDDGPTANVTIFADRQVDRCPTGSGVIARMAADYAKNKIKPGVKRDFIGRTGSVFTGEIKEELIYKKKNAVKVEVSGQSHYLGRSTFYLEKGDELGRGFFVR